MSKDKKQTKEKTKIRPSQRRTKPLRASIGERVGGAFRRLFSRKTKTLDSEAQSTEQAQPGPSSTELAPVVGPGNGATKPAPDRTRAEPKNGHRRSNDRRHSKGRRGKRRPHRGQRSRRSLNRLAAELAYIGQQSGVTAELLPGTPATIAMHRGSSMIAMLVVGDEHKARKILGLPHQPHRDRRAERLFEIDRRHYADVEERYASN